MFWICTAANRNALSDLWLATVSPSQAAFPEAQASEPRWAGQCSFPRAFDFDNMLKGYDYLPSEAKHWQPSPAFNNLFYLKENGIVVFLAVICLLWDNAVQTFQISFNKTCNSMTDINSFRLDAYCDGLHNSSELQERANWWNTIQKTVDLNDIKRSNIHVLLKRTYANFQVLFKLLAVL